nr:unnamed protein product [Papilio xuthus]
MSNTTVCSRPNLIPYSVTVENDHVKIYGFLKKGFVSDSVIVNGKHEMKILEVKADRIYSGEELNLKDDEINQFSTVNEFNEDEMEVEEIEEVECFSEEMNDEVSTETESEAYPSLIDQYKDYRGIRDISTCDFPTDKYPSFYKDLVFFEDFRAVEKFITKRKSIMPDNQMVEVILKAEYLFNENIFVLFNNYVYENLKTIHNYVFNVKDKPLDSKPLIVDFGHRLLKVKPTLTKEANQRTFKKEKELNNGVNVLY